MAVVLGLTWGVDAYIRVELDGLTVFLVSGNLDGLRDRAVVELGQAFDVEGLVTGKTQRLVGFTIWELQWRNTHTDQVRAVDTLEGFGNDGAYA